MLLENNPYPQDVRVRSEAESLVRAGHEVTAVAPNDGTQPRREQINGVDVIRFRLPVDVAGTKAGFVREYLVATLALHAAAVSRLMRGSTVLHLHNPPDVLFGAGALYRLAGRRVVFDHHDLFPETIGVKFGSGPVSRLAARIAGICQWLTIAVADHVIATNRSYADVSHRAGKRPGEVTVVRNGPPAAWTEHPSTERTGVLAQVRIAYLGAMSSQDGVDGLAPILDHLCHHRDVLDARLVMIGDGDARPALEAEMAARGLAARVQFTGRVEPGRVLELLADVDICVDPAPATDVNQRSTMTKIAEYLALGKPVVAYDLLETRRTVDGAALLVPPGDVDGFAEAVRLLARDPDVRGRLARAARRRAQALTWQHSEQALLRVYDGLALRGRRLPDVGCGPDANPSGAQQETPADGR